MREGQSERDRERRDKAREEKSEREVKFEREIQ